MSIILFAAVAVIAIASGARILGRGRTIVPLPLADREESMVTSFALRERRTSEPPAEPTPAVQSMPAQSMPMRSTPQAGYLVSAAHPARAADRTAAMLDAMNGPGLCTPPAAPIRRVA